MPDSVGARIFLSWAGESSGSVARTMREWLPLVTGCTDPWSSSQDLALGSHWPVELARQLQICDFGILILTPDNVASPWLLFEAGALSKNSMIARVIPYLVGVAPSELVGPLRYFQAVMADRNGSLRLVLDVGKMSGISPAQVEARFDLLWPKLEDVLSQSSVPTTPITRSDSLESVVQPLSQRVDELTALVRNLVETDVVGQHKPTRVDPDLIHLEGQWVSEYGSHLYARIIGSDLHVPYSFKGNETLSGVYTRWQRVGQYWFATYRWFNHKIQGFIFCRIVSRDTIEGMWWSTKRGAGDTEYKLPDQSGQRMRWSRRNDASIPNWAEAYFRDVADRRGTA